MTWTPAASTYVVTIPHAADPTTSSKITVTLPGHYASKQDAAFAAAAHLAELSDAELQVMLQLQMKAASVG